MCEVTFDKNGYPTEETLAIIRAWDAYDFSGLATFVCEAWHKHGTFTMTIDRLKMVTGGWSGNESIISAMGQNTTWWTLHWWSSQRGGYHEFRTGRYRHDGPSMEDMG